MFFHKHRFLEIQPSALSSSQPRRNAQHWLYMAYGRRYSNDTISSVDTVTVASELSSARHIIAIFVRQWMESPFNLKCSRRSDYHFILLEIVK